MALRSFSKRGEVRKVRYENTYKMKPGSEEEFKASDTTKAIENVLRRELANSSYEERWCKQKVTILADLIKDEVKYMGYRRHKIICHVVLGQTFDQGIEMGSRGLCDPSVDSWACASYRNDSLFAVATVHAFYAE